MQGVNKYANEVRENTEIEFNGLTFYPLTVRDFPLYRSAAAAFELMQSSLPPKFARLSWCQCLDEMDKLGNGSPFLEPVLNVVAKALRLERIKLPDGAYGYQLSTLRKEGTLMGIYIREHETVLTIQMMDEVRQIIAAQNDYQLPDEKWNPELVAAEQYLNGQNMPKLDIEIEAWVYSVAANVGKMRTSYGIGRYANSEDLTEQSTEPSVTKSTRWLKRSGSRSLRKARLIRRGNSTGFRSCLPDSRH